jgi:hypothetical protein
MEGFLTVPEKIVSLCVKIFHTAFSKGSAVAEPQTAEKSHVFESIHAHVGRQVPKPLFNVIQNVRDKVYIVNVGGRDTDIDYNIVLAVCRAVLTVVKTVRLSFLVQLTTFRIFFLCWIWVVGGSSSSFLSKGFLPNASLSAVIAASSSSIYALGDFSMVTVDFLCLFALLSHG